MTRRYVVLGIGTADLPTTAEALFAYRRRFIHAIVDRSGAPGAAVSDRAAVLDTWTRRHGLDQRGDWVSDWLAQTVLDWRRDATRRAAAWIGPEPRSAMLQSTAGPPPTMRFEATAAAADTAESEIEIRFDWAARRYLGDAPRTIAGDESMTAADDPRAVANQVRQTSDGVLRAIGLQAPPAPRGRPKPEP